MCVCKLNVSRLPQLKFPGDVHRDKPGLVIKKETNILPQYSPKRFTLMKGNYTKSKNPDEAVLYRANSKNSLNTKH